MPLVFGKRLLGTFDFEQFELEPAGELDLTLDRRELCAHLEWGRSISFLIAYLEDAKAGLAERSLPFERFQLLCAQLIAEVPVEDEQFMQIATNALAEIVPVKNAQLEKSGSAIDENKLIAQLRFRGAGDHRLSWEPDPASGALLESLQEAEPGKTVTSMMTSYHALIQSLRPQDLGDTKFLTAIEQIGKDLQIEEADLTDPSRDAGESILNVFSFLHSKLLLYLQDPPKQPGAPDEPNRYAWFLHVRCLDPETGRQAWVCNPGSTNSDYRLASCYTTEMKDILEQTRTLSKGSRRTALAEVVAGRARAQGDLNEVELTKVINGMTAGLHDEPPDEDIVKTITAWLSLPKSDDGDESDESKKAIGFTKSVAKAGHPIVVPQINLSPNRSERDHGWFWTETYTVLGIPFMLKQPNTPTASTATQDECVAVLNVFRRREIPP